MKNLLLLLALAVSYGFSADKIYLKSNEGRSIPLMAKTNSPVYIDTSESDTSDIYFDLTDSPMAHFADTLGVAWMRCDDSAGTDSVGGQLIWQGNPRADGSALWESIDTLSILAASGTETQSKAPVVNLHRYMALRFILKNQLAPEAGEKTVCRDIILNRHRRLVD